MDGVINYKETRFELFFAVYSVCNTLVNMVLEISRHFLSIGKIDTAILYGTVLLLFFLSCRTFFQRIQSWQIWSSIIVVSIVLLGTLFSPDASVNFTVLRDILLFCIPLYLAAGCVRDFDALYRYYQIIFRIVPIVGLISFFLSPIFASSLNNNYSQYLSYRYLLPCAFLLVDCFYSFSWKSLLPLVVGLFLMLSFGARGPFVSILLLTSIMIIYKIGLNNLRNKIVLTLLLLGAVFFISNNFQHIVTSLLDLFNARSLSTRVLSMMMDNNMLEDENRDAIFSLCWNYCKENPLIGTLPINDRFIIAHPTEQYDVISHYPHNFILEVLMQYGLIFGLLFLWLYIRVLIKGIKQAQSKKQTFLLFVFLGSALFPLLFSMSYIQEELFYATTALFIISNKLNSTDAETNN